MIETQARVVAVEAGYAWVESEQRSGCSHCSSRGGCGVSVLSKLFGVHRQRLRLADPLGLHSGDEVVIGLSERRLVAAAALAYLLPLVAMIGMALFSAALGYGQGVLAVSSLAGLAAGLWLLKDRSGSRQTLAHYRPVILGRHRPSECTIEFKPGNRGANHE